MKIKRNYNFWMEKEIKYLKENYLILDIKILKNYLNRSEGSIRRKACRSNLTENHSWTEEEIKYLKNNYKFRNKKNLLNNLNHSWIAIQIKASKLNLAGIDIDEDFFKKWTKEMAWTFGLWIADGNMYEKYNSISLSSKDYDLLEIVKSNLKSMHKISKDKNNVFQFRFSNKILYDDLFERGGTPAKSLSIQFPDAPDKFLPHLIRGYLDGDGSNYIHNFGKYRYLDSNFVGNIDFLSVLKNKIKENININPTSFCIADKNCNERIYRLGYFNKKAIALGDYVYQDSKNLRLERKFKIYDKMKKEYLKKLEKKAKK